jgi:hypothetical protein
MPSGSVWGDSDSTDAPPALSIDGAKVTYSGYDMTTDVFPYNVQITPDGALGPVNNNGSGCV